MNNILTIKSGKDFAWAYFKKDLGKPNIKHTANIEDNLALLSGEDYQSMDVKSANCNISSGSCTITTDNSENDYESIKAEDSAKAERQIFKSYSEFLSHNFSKDSANPTDVLIFEVPDDESARKATIFRGLTRATFIFCQENDMIFFPSKEVDDLDCALIATKEQLTSSNADVFEAISDLFDIAMVKRKRCQGTAFALLNGRLAHEMKAQESEGDE